MCVCVCVCVCVCGVSSVQPCMGYLQRVCPELCVVWELTLEKILPHHLPVTAFLRDDHTPHSPTVKARIMIDKLVPTCLKVASTFKRLHWSRTSSEFITCFESIISILYRNSVKLVCKSRVPSPSHRSGAAPAQKAKAAPTRGKKTEIVYESMYDLDETDKVNCLRNMDRTQWNHQLVSGLKDPDLTDTCQQ